jgi:eukaryotic-like serine/threonine-protein kinase
MATRVGTSIDRYEIDAELGRGAMGVVYRARDPKLDRTVAIKTISLAGLEVEAEQEYRKRFVVEAQAAGRLSHPGIVTMFDVREEEPEPFLVMEYVKGQSLEALVSRENRTLPLSTTLKLVQEIAEALHYAHAQGVVHRDIKPANILVDENGNAKIADFGIAKLNQSSMTVHGQILGSPAYMAPEQLSEGSVDGRSDLFSLGVIFYYMLTGHRPFQGNSTTTVCFKLVNHDPLPVSSFQPKLSPELDSIVLRAMAKDPEQRYQTGMAMASDIERLRESSGFAKRTSEWTTTSLKRDAIPRYVSGSSAKSMAVLTATQKLAAPKKAKWNPFVASAILAVAMAASASWALLRTKPGQVPSPVMQTAVSPTVKNIEIDDPSEPEIKTVAAPKPRRKSPSAKPKAPPVAPKVQLAAAVIPAPVAATSGTMRIEIAHDFTEAHASVWVDNKLVYEHLLHGDSTRKNVVFRKVEGYQLDAVSVSSGKHTVRVRIESPSDSYDQTSSMVDANIGVSDSILHISCGKKSRHLELKIE